MSKEEAELEVELELISKPLDTIGTFINGMVFRSIIINIISLSKATITTPTLPLVRPLTTQGMDPPLLPIHLNHRVNRPLPKG